MDLSLDSIPQTSMSDYCLEPAEKNNEEGEKEGEKINNETSEGRTGDSKASDGKCSLVIFAIDKSESMKKTTTVPELQG